MSYIVYGLRLRGEREVRYIGFTRKTPEERLARHLRYPITVSDQPLLPWLRRHREDVEAFTIARCDSEEMARVTEQVVIALCLRMNQRLLNAAHVPTHLRIAA